MPMNFCGENPHLLSQLHYTLAAVKETLSSARSGEPGYSIQGLDPTDGFHVWSNSWAIRRDPNYWPELNEFLPERWLIEEGDRL